MRDPYAWQAAVPGDCVGLDTNSLHFLSETTIDASFLPNALNAAHCDS